MEDTINTVAAFVFAIGGLSLAPISYWRKEKSIGVRPNAALFVFFFFRPWAYFAWLPSWKDEKAKRERWDRETAAVNQWWIDTGSKLQ